MVGVEPVTTPGSHSRLVAIDQANWRDALRVRVSDEQLPMVADSQPVALVILAKAYVREGGRRWEPLAYLDADGAIVAVLAVTHADDTVEVRNVAVDLDRQRTGVGTKVMQAVMDRCRSQGCRSVELTFRPANEAAARLYGRVGFGPTGETRNGEPVWRLSLADQPNVP